MRLTVATIFGMIGTLATGILGMNIFDFTNDDSWPWWTRLVIFLLVAVPSTLLVLFTISKSKILSDFLEVLPNERLRFANKLGTLLATWRRKRPKGRGAAGNDSGVDNGT
jgi:hypothetical protein